MRIAVQISFQLAFDHLGMKALDDAADSVQHQFFHASRFFHAGFELSAGRQEKNVG